MGASSDFAADIVIPVHNGFVSTRALIEGIYRYSDIPFHIYVIDNASTDETVDLHKIYTRDITIVRYRTKRGWSSAVNQGIRQGRNSYLLLMNNTIEVSRGWLGNLMAFLDSHPRIGAVGPMSSDPKHWQCIDRVRENIVPQIPGFLTEDLHKRNQILSYHFHRAGILVEGVLALYCMALKRRVINEVGLLDETLPDEDVEGDYCRRLRNSSYVLGLSLDTYILHNPDGAYVPDFAFARGNRLREKNLVRLKTKLPVTR
jgi:GT2 family glycosyltransferase